MKRFPHEEMLRIGFLNLDERRQQQLFYLSLFDPTSGWEEGADFDLKDIEKKIISIITDKCFGNLGKNFKRLPNDEKKVLIQCNFYTGHVANLLLYYFSKKNGLECKPGDVNDIHDIYLPDHCIQLKRLISMGNIIVHLNDHADSIRSNGNIKHQHVILLLFPLKYEEYNRFNKLAGGYKPLIEYYFEKKHGIKVKTFIKAVTEFPEKGKNVLNEICGIFKNLSKDNKL